MSEPTSLSSYDPFSHSFELLTKEEKRTVLRADFLRQWQQGEEPRVEDYLEKLPSLQKESSLLLEIIALEIDLRRSQGDSPELQEYAQRFPQLQAGLQLHFALPPSQPPSVPELPAIGPTLSHTWLEAPVPPEPDAPIEEESSGEDIGGYELVEELGRGGMGVVYKAHQKGLDRFVALKMLRSVEQTTAEDRERFERETRIIATLRHPNIVQIYEVGKHQDKPYFSMELIEGGSLAQKLNEGPLSATEAAELIETLASAIHVAHQQGVIHRDLSPGNVLMGKEGPVITDFGLAKRLEEGGQTQTGAIMGTPYYMSPEQAQGQNRQMGPGVDVYALGAILYECLTGRPPFTAASVMETLIQVMSSPPVPPKVLQPECPVDLETICLKCLEKDPTRRYATALHLAHDLHRFRTGHPIQARPVSRREKLWQWVKRNPVVASLLLLVALTLSVGAGAASFFAIEAQREAQRADEKAGEAQIKQQLAEEKTKEAGASAVQAQKERERAEWLLYASQLKVAHQLWKEGRSEEPVEILDKTRWDLRGLEHRYLHTLFHHQGQVPFQGHDNVVFGVAVDPQGRLLASASRDGTVRLWSLETGKTLFVLNGHRGTVHCVAFSADGSQVISGGADHTIRIWSSKTGKQIRELKGHTDVVHGIAITPNSQQIVSAGYDKTIRIWNRKTGKEERVIRDHALPILGVSADSHRIAAGGLDRVVRIYDLKTGNRIQSCYGHDQGINSVALSPNGLQVVSTSDDQTIRVWDIQSGALIHTLREHRRSVLSVAISPDGLYMASGGADRTAKIWDLSRGELLFSCKGHQGSVQSLAFAPNGQRLITGSFDHSVRVWSTRNGQQETVIKGHRNSVTGVSLSQKGDRLITSGQNGLVKVWNATTGEELAQFNHITSALGCALSPNGDKVASVDSRGTIKIWQAENGKELLSIPASERALRTVAFSPNGQWLVTGGDDFKLRAYDAKSGKERLVLEGHTSSIRGAAISSDGRRIASASWDGTIRLYDAKTGKPLRVISGTGEPFLCIAFSPDDQSLLSGSQDHLVRTWNALTGEPLQVMKGHTGPVLSVAFSPNDKRILSTSVDGTCRIWEAQRGVELLTLRNHKSRVSAVAISGNALRFATGSPDTTARIYHAEKAPEALVFRGAESRVTQAGFSANGNTVVGIDERGKQYRWDSKTGQQLPNSSAKLSEPLRRLSNGFRLEPDGLEIRLVRDRAMPEVSHKERLSQMVPLGQWHQEHVQQAQGEGQWYAAAFHLNVLLEEQWWRTSLHVQRAYALMQLDRKQPALSHYLQAMQWEPGRQSWWPKDRQAEARAQKAIRQEDWPVAVEALTLMAHQRSHSVKEWLSLLLAQRAGGKEALYQKTLSLVLDRFEEQLPLSPDLEWLIGPSEEVARVVAIAEKAAQQRTGEALCNLGAALYYAGRYKEALLALEEAGALSSKPPGRLWLYMTMSHSRMQHPEQARKYHSRYKLWKKETGRPAHDWQKQTLLEILETETTSVLRMPVPMVPGGVD